MAGFLGKRDTIIVNSIFNDILDVSKRIFAINPHIEKDIPTALQEWIYVVHGIECDGKMIPIMLNGNRLLIIKLKNFDEYIEDAAVSGNELVDYILVNADVDTYGMSKDDRADILIKILRFICNNYKDFYRIKDSSKMGIIFKYAPIIIAIDILKGLDEVFDYNAFAKHSGDLDKEILLKMSGMSFEELINRGGIIGFLEEANLL